MSDLIDALLNRRSCPAAALTEPAPDAAALDELVRCALTAPDHGGLTPWRFTVFRGVDREQLGAALAETARAADPALDEEGRAKIAGKATRAPLVIGCGVVLREDIAKVPPFEQILSAGAAIAQLQMAADARGFGSMWTTGPHANGAAVKALLGLQDSDLVAGFLHLGTREASPPARERPAVTDCLRTP